MAIECATQTPNVRFPTTTPVGFEPTQGDPIGLAGRRLNHSAKVSVSSLKKVAIAVNYRGRSRPHFPLRRRAPLRTREYAFLDIKQSLPGRFEAGILHMGAVKA